MVTFFWLAHFSWNMKQGLVCEGLEIQVEAVATFLILFEAHTNILFIIKVQTLANCVPIVPTMVIVFWGGSSISSNHMLFWCPFLGLNLTAYHSNIGVHIAAMLQLGMSIISHLGISLWAWPPYTCLNYRELEDWWSSSIVLSSGWKLVNSSKH